LNCNGCNGFFIREKGGKNKMSNIWNTILKKKNHEFQARNESQNLDDICGISIDEFKKRKIGVEILNKSAWLCSNKEMVDQILEDDRTATAYTLDELIKLIELNPSKDFLKKIHNTKAVFENSKIIQTINKKKTDYD